MRRRCVIHIAALNRDRLRQVRVVLEEDSCGHHFRDARDGTLILRIRFPEHLVGLRVIDDRRCGSNVRHQIAARVYLVTRQHGIGNFPRCRHRARTGQLGLACPRPLS